VRGTGYNSPKLEVQPCKRKVAVEANVKLRAQQIVPACLSPFGGIHLKRLCVHYVSLAVIRGGFTAEVTRMSSGFTEKVVWSDLHCGTDFPSDCCVVWVHRVTVIQAHNVRKCVLHGALV
jgi:hypothetical protein